jgi:cytochrome c oxidase subunit 2
LPALSVGAHDFDTLEGAVVVGGILFVVVALGLSIFFVLRYRRQSAAVSAPPELPSSSRLVWAATGVVIALVGSAFYLGLLEYVNDAVAPAAALEISAQGSGDDWSFSYPNGSAPSDNVLRLPEGRPVTLALAVDQDGPPATFTVPELRVRTRVLPGTLPTVFIEGNTTGKAHVVDAKGHPVSEIEFLPPADFDEYMRVGPSNPYCTSQDACTPELEAKWGQDLFAQNGCIGCHSRDGSKLVGPSFKGVYGRDEVMSTGLVIHIDDAYIKESIRQPQAKIVKGFTNVAMPSFATLSDRKVDALVEYLKTVK